MRARFPQGVLGASLPARLGSAAWFLCACASAAGTAPADARVPYRVDAGAPDAARGADAGGTADAGAPSLGPLGGVRFVDVTAEAGLAGPRDAHRTYGECLLDALPTPAPDDLCHPEWFAGGAAVGDIDGDGLEDLWVARVDGRDGLYRNLGGRFVDVAESAGLLVSRSVGGAFADVDADGDLDLFVTTLADRRHLLYVNDGTGRFTEEGRERGAALATGFAHSGMTPAFGDTDLDGDLDLYVTEWRPFLELHDGPPLSVLLRNLGPERPGHFQDVTSEAGLALDPALGSGSAGPGVFTFHPSFVDLDGDLWPELALAGDFGTSRLFWNRGDRFVDGTDAARVGTERYGMGSAFGDVDGDGDLDWLVTSIFAPPWAPAEEDTGNRLYLNEGGRRFRDATDAFGLRDGGWGWGAVFFDPDADGDLDVAMVGGYWVPEYLGSGSRLFESGGSVGPMREVAAAVGFAGLAQGRGVLLFDYDADGDQDLLVTRNAAAPVLLRCDAPPELAWLRVRVERPLGNGEGLGARVRARLSDGRVLHRVIGAEAGFLGQGERVASLGLGRGGARVVELRVEDPTSGRAHVLAEVPAGGTVVVPVAP